MLKNIDFIGIGVGKAGTTWIFECLKEHPEICVSSEKEIHFFDYLSNYKKGLKYYNSFFKHCPHNKIKGEITPNYIYSHHAPFLIHKHFPDVKLIACLRNPVERAYSDYRFNIEMKGRLRFYKDFEEAMIRDRHILERGFYYKQLERFFKLFPRRQILILFFNELKENPKEFIKKVYKFLGVNNIDFIPSHINKKVRETGSIKTIHRIPLISPIFYRCGSWLSSKNLARDHIENSKIFDYFIKIVDFNLKTVKKKRNRFVPTPPLDIRNRKSLFQVYKNDIIKLENLLDKDLSFWKV